MRDYEPYPDVRHEEIEARDERFDVYDAEERHDDGATLFDDPVMDKDYCLMCEDIDPSTKHKSNIGDKCYELENAVEGLMELVKQ